MSNELFDQEITSHQDDIETLHTLSPQIESHQAEISRFLLAYPGLIGISYSGAEVLMREKDVDIRIEAIHRVIEEKKKRGDINAPDFCFARRNVSENQIRRIVAGIKTKNAPVNSIKKAREGDTRSKVISFRATVDEEDAIDFLANRTGITKSALIDILITISNRYGIMLKETKK